MNCVAMSNPLPKDLKDYNEWLSSYSQCGEPATGDRGGFPMCDTHMEMFAPVVDDE